MEGKTISTPDPSATKPNAAPLPTPTAVPAVVGASATDKSSNDGPPPATGTVLGDNMLDGFEKLFALKGKQIGENAPSSQSKPDDTPVKTEVKPPAPSDEKPDEQKPATGEKPKETPASPVPAAKKVQMQSLRDALTARKARIATLEAENAALKERLGKPGDDPERKIIEAKLTETEKRAQQLEEHLNQVDYEASDQFKKEYHEPYVKAVQRGMAEAKELLVGGDAEGEGARAITDQEFWGVVTSPNAQQALAAAHAISDSEAVVGLLMTHRRDIRAAFQRLEEAKSNHAANRVELAKTALRSAQEAAQRREQTWQTANESFIKRAPALFSPIEKDEEGNKLLEAGYDLAYRGFGMKGNLSEEEAPVVHAEILHKAAGFDRLALHYRRAINRIKALEEELKEFNKSAPSVGQVTGAEPPIEDDMMARLAKYAHRAS